MFNPNRTHSSLYQALNQRPLPPPAIIPCSVLHLLLGQAKRVEWAGSTEQLAREIAITVQPSPAPQLSPSTLHYTPQGDLSFQSKEIYGMF